MAPLTDASSTPERLLARVRAGDGATLGRLLEQYRNYLWLVARGQLATDLRVRIAPSDVLEATDTGGYPLNEDEITWQLEFFGGRPGGPGA